MTNVVLYQWKVLQHWQWTNMNDNNQRKTVWKGLYLEDRGFSPRVLTNFFPFENSHSQKKSLVVIWQDRAPKISPCRFFISTPSMLTMIVLKLAKPLAIGRFPNHRTIEGSIFVM
jgi:hypothetical protein